MGPNLLSISSRKLDVLTNTSFWPFLFQNAGTDAARRRAAPREVPGGSFARRLVGSRGARASRSSATSGGKDRLEYTVVKGYRDADICRTSDSRPAVTESRSSSIRFDTTTAARSRSWTSPAKRRFSPTATGERRDSRGRRRAMKSSSRRARRTTTSSPTPSISRAGAASRCRAPGESRFTTRAPIGGSRRGTTS